MISDLDFKHNVGVLLQVLPPEVGHETGDDKNMGVPGVSDAIFIENL